MFEDFEVNQFLRFLRRFSLTHTLTYLVFGLFFMVLSNYFSVFREDVLLSQVMKPAHALSVRMAPLVQLLRGALLATAIYPFRTVIFQRKNGWLTLFWLMFVLTGIGAVITGPGSIEGYLYTNFSFDPFFGYPEIALQMLAFSWLFVRWQLKTDTVTISS